MRLQNLLTLAAAAAAVSAKHAPKLANPCLQKPYATLPFCNASLSNDQRARDAVGRMSLSEKIDALGSKQGPTPSLGLGTYDWWSEATSGIANGEHGAPGEHTHFAYPVTTGMAFNRSLWRATGYTIGREARALMNAGQAYSTLWAPVVNLALHPRWGRNIEVPGEDPFLTGEYAFAFIRGLQNEEGGFLQASACCKHFVANELEKTTQPDGEEWDRRHDDAQVTERDLADSYFPPFQACVKAGVTGLMCSYNALNGVPACANKKLLDTARSWGFNGYVTSDCDADRNVFNTHKYAPTRTEAVRDVLGAGTDVDCGGFVSRHARAALDEGLIDENIINERLVNLFTVRLRLGPFDLSFDVTRPRGPLDRITAQAVCAEAHRETSREGLAQAATLYKNNGVLPLCAKTVLVSGPTANISRATASYYGPRVVCEGAYPGLIDAVRDGGRVQVTYEQDLACRRRGKDGGRSRFGARDGPRLRAGGQGRAGDPAAGRPAAVGNRRRRGGQKSNNDRPPHGDAARRREFTGQPKSRCDRPPRPAVRRCSSLWRPFVRPAVVLRTRGADGVPRDVRGRDLDRRFQPAAGALRLLRGPTAPRRTRAGARAARTRGAPTASTKGRASCPVGSGSPIPPSATGCASSPRRSSSRSRILVIWPPTTSCSSSWCRPGRAPTGWLSRASWRSTASMFLSMRLCPWRFRCRARPSLRPACIRSRPASAAMLAWGSMRRRSFRAATAAWLLYSCNIVVSGVFCVRVWQSVHSGWVNFGAHPSRPAIEAGFAQVISPRAEV